MFTVTLLLVSALLHQSFCDDNVTTGDPLLNMTCCDLLEPKCPTNFTCHENPAQWGCRCVMPPEIDLQRMQQAELVRAKYGHHDDHDHEDENAPGPTVNLGGR